MCHFLILALAVLLDRFVGDPDWLWRRLPHPVVWFGKLIDLGVRFLIQKSAMPSAMRGFGWCFIIIATVVVALMGWALSPVFDLLGIVGFALEIVLVAVFIAHKSLADHVGAILVGLQSDGLAGGRRALSMIVGRDTSELDVSQISRAAIESLAENFSDGVVAPVFWYAVLGLPGILAYKFVNTADSMIGHKTERFLYFGRGAALLDDALNFIPARLSAFVVSVASFAMRILNPSSLPARAEKWALLIAFRDAGLHRSPNAGWPEGAFAGALNISLGGPRVYKGEGLVAAPAINAGGRSQLTSSDVRSALMLFSACGWVMLSSISLLALVV